MTTIDITSELNSFEVHLDHNPRTIFSAKFGDGKTYFLNEYRKMHAYNTKFIVLHPINYSVATNEDIFEYIKRDILVELAKNEEFKEVDWDKVAKTVFNFDSLLEESEFVFSDASPLLKAALVPFRLFKKVDDKYAIDKFFDRFSQMKGGIYEQDPFTFAIQAAVAKLHEYNRKCVLIMEDLDRIDPGHLFRILNVLGAHVDEENDTNKFGFDNIVAVLDYYTTEHIFHHFYGENADYKGYIAKFICHNFFEYSLKKEARRQLYELLQNECGLDGNDIRQYEWYQEGNFTKSETIFKRIETLSVRDVVHILDDLQGQQKSMHILESGNRILLENNQLVKLLSIFVRMNFKFTTDNLTTFLTNKKEHFMMLGDFLCLQQREYVHTMLSFSGGEYMMVYVDTAEDGLLKVRYGNGPYNNQYKGTDMKNAIGKIMPVIYGCVYDCKPLG